MQGIAQGCRVAGGEVAEDCLLAGAWTRGVGRSLVCRLPPEKLMQLGSSGSLPRHVLGRHVPMYLSVLAPAVRYTIA